MQRFQDYRDPHVISVFNKLVSSLPSDGSVGAVDYKTDRVPLVISRPAPSTIASRAKPIPSKSSRVWAYAVDVSNSSSLVRAADRAQGLVVDLQEPPQGNCRRCRVLNVLPL